MEVKCWTNNQNNGRPNKKDGGLAMNSGRPDGSLRLWIWKEVRTGTKAARPKYRPVRNVLESTRRRL